MKILICSDGSQSSERALRFGVNLAAGCHAEVTLLGIMETAGPDERLLETLKRGQALLEDKKIHAELITKTGEPLTEIRRRTEETHYDLVVIGAVQKGAHGLFWLSSKAYKIIKEIQPPVLLVAGQCSTLRRVLVCSGGRPYIDQGVQLTGRIAQGMGATATLLHVMPDPPAIYAGWPRIAETPERLLKSKSELGLNLRREKEMLENQGVATELRLRHGPVLDQILQEIATGNYDLVVTGSALSHGLRTYILGDISREIVNRARCAVLVARSQLPPVETRSWFPLWRA